MELKCFSLAFLTGIAVLASGSPVNGQVVRSLERQALFSDLSTTDAMGNLLVTGDLLTTATPDVPFPAFQNNDLLSDDAANLLPGPEGDDSEAVVAGEGPSTYTFSSPAEITQIDVYSAWRDARAGQNLEISLSTDGTNFVPLINYDVSSGGNEVVLSSITANGGGSLGSDILAIRFPPGAGLINGSGGVFRDIDVIGTTVDLPIVLGDVNLDGTVNFADISPFIAVLTSQDFQLEADIDENGFVNFADISPFIGILTGG